MSYQFQNFARWQLAQEISEKWIFQIPKETSFAEILLVAHKIKIIFTFELMNEKIVLSINSSFTIATSVRFVFKCFF